MRARRSSASSGGATSVACGLGGPASSATIRAGRGLETSTRSASSRASSRSCVTSSAGGRASAQTRQYPAEVGAGQRVERAERLVQQPPSEPDSSVRASAPHCRMPPDRAWG